MQTNRATWRKVTRFSFARSFAGALFMNLGCSGGLVDNPGSGGGTASVGTGGAGIGGGTAIACYSPTQNLGSAYQPGAKGCTCNPAADADVCVQGVGLVCMSNAWVAVEDGPCMPAPATGGAGNVGTGGAVGIGGSGTGGVTAPTCFSPTQNMAGVRPGTPGGCACNAASSVCVGGVGLICSGGYWIAVWDGPCMPGTGGKTSIGSGGSSTGSTTAPKRCGARAGSTCTASEYCAYGEGELCGRGDMEAICKPRPQVCDGLYAPVCGCDNKTYSNSCVAAAAGIGVYTNSACAN